MTSLAGNPLDSCTCHTDSRQTKSLTLPQRATDVPAWDMPKNSFLHSQRQPSVIFGRRSRRFCLRREGLTTLRVALTSKLWERHASAHPSRVIVHTGAARASAIADWYLLLSSWNKPLEVVQEDLDLVAVRELGIPGITWNGTTTTSSSVWLTSPCSTMKTDATLDTLNAWLERTRQLEQVRLAIEKIIIEASDNAREHSHSTIRPLLIATLQHHEVECAITDAGRGVRQALQYNYPHLASDVEAVRLAMQPGVSGVPEPGRGGGLTTIARAIAAHAGTLVFRSNAGQVTNEPSPQGTKSIEMALTLSAPGTQVLARIPRKTA